MEFANGASFLFAVTVVLAALLLIATAAALTFLLRLKAHRHEADGAQSPAHAWSVLGWEAIEALPIPIAIRDGQGVSLRVNKAFLLNAGAAAAIDGHATAPFTLPDAPSRGAPDQQREIQYLSDDAVARSAILWNSPMFDEKGDIVGSVHALFDITALRESERIAQAARQNFVDITQSMSVVAFSLMREADGLRRLEFITGDLGAMFRLRQADLLEGDDALRERPFHDSVHPEDIARFEKLLSFDAPPKVVRSEDFRTFGTSGLRWIHALVTLHRQPGGQTSVVGYFVDTTQANAQTEALRVARDVAERASRAKTDFLATMSQEIRTPMNGVMGKLELLARSGGTPEQGEILRTVESSATTFLQILNDVLDFSKLEAGDMHLDLAPFDPRLLVDNVAVMMAAQIEEKELDFHVALDVSLAGLLIGDGARLHQVLINLLSNALKFTERGRIEVHIDVVGDDGEQQRLRISVVDTGIGIAANRQGGLFSPFKQAEPASSGRHGGSALRLAICRQLIQLMGGLVELESAPGAGTTVVANLRLPVARREIEAPATLRGRHAVIRVASIETAATLNDHLVAMGMTVENIPPSEPMRKGLAASFLFVAEDDQHSAIQVDAHLITIMRGPGSTAAEVDPSGRVLLSARPLSWQALARACLLAISPDSAPPSLPTSPMSSDTSARDFP
jgi:signal transduction histidine kinase